MIETLIRILTIVAIPCLKRRVIANEVYCHLVARFSKEHSVLIRRLEMDGCFEYNSLILPFAKEPVKSLEVAFSFTLRAAMNKYFTH